MYARTISGDLFLFVITYCASLLQCTASLLDSAPVDGIKRAEAARIEVKRNALLLLTNFAV